MVPDFSHLDGPADPFIARDFDDEWVNLLFVGRIIPNKRIDELIRIFHAYKTRFNPRSRLIVVGAYGGFETYLAMLHGLVGRLGTKDVHLPGHVSERRARRLLRRRRPVPLRQRARGFCVPLTEAFYKRLPVVAYAATAVPSTMDGGGVLYEDRDPAHVAALIDAVLDDGALYEDVARVAGRRARTAPRARLRRHAAAVRRPGADGPAASARPRCRSTSGTSSWRTSG